MVVTARGGLYEWLDSVLDRSNNAVERLNNRVTAGSGLEVHGIEGSIVARDVMTQRAGGEVLLRTASGEREIPVAHENLYARALAPFNAAVRGEGQPAATGEDGARSLATALAVLESTRTGARVAVHF